MFNDDAKKRSPSLPSFHIFSIFRISYEYFMIRSSDVSASAPLRSLFLPRRPFPPFSYPPPPLFPPVPSLLTVIIYFFSRYLYHSRTLPRKKYSPCTRKNLIFFLSFLAFFLPLFFSTHTKSVQYNDTCTCSHRLLFSYVSLFLSVSIFGSITTECVSLSRALSPRERLFLSPEFFYTR